MSIMDNVFISACDWDSLDRLFGQALLDETVCRRFVEQRDETLLTRYRLSPSLQQWLMAIPANSLAELAQAVVAQDPDPIPGANRH
jgi:hypothetical protein